MRRAKLDALPQLINIMKGDMSFLGPQLRCLDTRRRWKGKTPISLTIRPGITGPATLEYRDEGVLLANAEDPEAYNRDVIYPDKVRMNRESVENWSLTKDLQYIWRTVVG